MNKNSNITRLLHDLTQKDYNITFSCDFQGMLNVSWGDEHTHLGIPYQSIKDLEKQLVNLLASLLEENN